jgi:preprotein translocase subunit SecG
MTILVSSYVLVSCHLQLQHHKSTGAGAGVGIQSSGAEEFTIMISSTQTFLSLRCCTYLVLGFSYVNQR